MLTIVRHGRTAINAEGRLLGRADPPLDDTGRRQATALAAAVIAAGGPPDRVVSSPLLRCRSTAEALGRPVEVDERFVELDYGDFDGLRMADVPAAVWQAWRGDLAFTPPNGESIAALSVRVRAGLDDLAANAVRRHVVVVTHVSPVKAALAWALGVGDEVCWRAFVAPASMMRVAVGDRGPSLHAFNDVAHLA